MSTNRRHVLKGLGGVLTLPLLESRICRAEAGNSKAHANADAGCRQSTGRSSGSLFPQGLWERLHTVADASIAGLAEGSDDGDFAHRSRHGEWPRSRGSFLNGVLPANAAAYPEKNMSVDQVMARHTSGNVRYSSINAALERGIRMNWTANGTELEPFTDPQKLFDHLFLNLSTEEKTVRRDLIERNGSILDAVRGQFAHLEKRASQSDKQRLDQYATSVRELEASFADRASWVDRDKPKFDISEHFSEYEVTVENRYNAIFDMIAYAFQQT